MQRLTLDRVPLMAMAGLWLLSWAGAQYYVGVGASGVWDPFSPVWAAYDPVRAAQLVAYVLVGALLAFSFPMMSSESLGSVGALTRRAVMKYMPIWMGVALGGLLLLIAVKGPYLLHAPRYLAFMAPQPLVSLANLLAPVTVVAAGISSTRNRIFGYALLIALLLVLFAYGTRVFAGVCLLFVIGRLIGGARVGGATWIMTAALTFLLLPVPLSSREQPEHGLLPYLSTLGTLLASPDYFGHAVSGAAENVGFSVPLLVFVADHTSFPWANMQASLNPAPAGLAGWTDVADGMRVHNYIPYSMLGEFAHFGAPALIAAVALHGLFLRWAIARCSQRSNPLMTFFLAGALGLALISVVYASQYNTRSVMRVLSMLLILMFAESAVRHFHASRRRMQALDASRSSGVSGIGQLSRTSCDAVQQADQEQPD